MQAINTDFWNEQALAQSVLIHATAVDFRCSPHSIASDYLIEPANGPEQYVQTALAYCSEIVALQAGRDSTSRSVSLQDINHSGLRATSAQSVRIMEQCAGIAIENAFTPHYYGLADVNSTDPDSAGKLRLDSYKGVAMAVRTEADLTVRAAHIAHDLKRGVERGEINGAQILEGRILSRSVASGMANFLLYGYTFRNNSEAPHESVHFADFPACEPFLAATVLEQINLADAVVRIVPRSFKKKEYAARWILQNMGHTALNVMSVSVGDGGNVNKIIHWQNRPSQQLINVAKGLRDVSHTAHH